MMNLISFIDKNNLKEKSLGGIINPYKNLVQLGGCE